MLVSKIMSLTVPGEKDLLQVSGLTYKTAMGEEWSHVDAQ